MTEVEWQNLNALALRKLATDGATVIVPVGSMEQHGPHLPVQVDALLAGEVARRAAQQVAATHPVVVAPTVWTGLAEHHMAFGGTFTLDFETFSALLGCLCRCIDRHGFPRILILNGHGGNVSALGVIAADIERDVSAQVAFVTYWHLTEVVSAFAKILELQSNVRHAGEAETSMLLALRPELVDREAMMSVDGGEADIVAADGLYRYRSFAELSTSGVIGYPAQASAHKGEQLLDAAAAALAHAVTGSVIWQ